MKKTKNFVFFMLVFVCVMFLCIENLAYTGKKSEKKATTYYHKQWEQNHKNVPSTYAITDGVNSYKTINFGNKEWIVLCEDNTKMLLLTKYAYAPLSYNYYVNPKYPDLGVTHSNCTYSIASIREYLNNKYISSTFSDNEIAHIIDCPINNNDGGGVVVDKVFLLSVDEANAYLNTPSKRQAMPYDQSTAIGNAKKNRNDDTGKCYWWLRTANDAMFKYAVDDNGNIVKKADSYVYWCRPAIWVNFNTTNMDVVLNN